MRRFISNCVQWLAILSSSVILIGAASAAPLDAIWVAVPGTIAPPATPAVVERISIRASGLDMYGLPQYFVRVISTCSGGGSCADAEIAARVYSGPTPMFTDFGFVAGPLGPTAPRPYVVFGRSPLCSAALRTDAMLALFVSDTTGAGYLGECFYRQPSPKSPNNSILDKIRKPVQLPHMPPIPRTPFAKGNPH